MDEFTLDLEEISKSARRNVIQRFGKDLQDFDKLRDLFYEQTAKRVIFQCNKCNQVHSIWLNGKSGTFSCQRCHTTFLYKYYFVTDQFIFVEQQVDWNTFRKEAKQEQRFEEYVHVHKKELTDFDILGISATKDVNVIKAAYRELCKRYHPDLNMNKTLKERTIMEEKMKEVNRAYDFVMRTL